MIEKQLLRDMPAPDYHAMDGLSNGGIKLLLRSAAHFAENKRKPYAPTPQMQFGTALHAATLEPERFDEIVLTVPKDAPDKRTKEGKIFWADIEARANGRVILKHEEALRAKACAASVRESPPASLFLENGMIESTVLWQHEIGDGVKVQARARPDFMTRDCSVMVDLKMADDASPAGFQRALWNFRYDIQAAWYIEGVTVVSGRLPHSFLFCVAEPDAPHAVAWYRVAPKALSLAWHDIQRAADLYRRCIETNTWPGYPDDIMQIELPRWARAATDPITE